MPGRSVPRWLPSHVLPRGRRSLGKGGRGDYTLLLQLKVCFADAMFLSSPLVDFLSITESIESKASRVMAKNTRKIKPANHGTRPASSKARKAKRAKVRT